MKLTSPSQVRSLLAELGLEPSSTLGQNFLIDHGAMQKIVDALGDVSQRTVIEIGAGSGALTSLLVPRAGHLVAVELDRVLAAQLRMEYSREPHIEIIDRKSVV